MPSAFVSLPVLARCAVESGSGCSLPRSLQSFCRCPALTKLAAYRGTSCDVDVAQYVVRRINRQKTPEVERDVVALEEMKHAVQVMRLLVPKDFEPPVDLMCFPSAVGVARLSVRRGRVAHVPIHQAPELEHDSVELD